MCVCVRERATAPVTMTARDTARSDVVLGAAFEEHARVFLLDVGRASESERSAVAKNFVARMVGQERCVRDEEQLAVLQRIADLEKKVLVREITATLMEQLLR